jgi:hypothetical protein
MKNYVVWTNCTITETTPQHGIEAAGQAGVQASYDHMFRISLRSAQKNLRGQWEPIVFDGVFEDRVSMFQSNWRRLSDLWHAEPCNILYLDSDTILIKPVEIFGRWPEYRLFNWSTPPRTEQFANYFNAAVRYHPAEMPESVWQTGERLARNWDLTIWDQEQIIFNHMFWSQGLSWEDAHHPELNWQADSGTTIPQLSEHGAFNNLPISQARIIHYHGSRSHSRGQSVADLLCSAANIV